MASSIIRRAREAVQRVNDGRKRLARERSRETGLIVGELVGTTLVVAAAVSDQKLGKGAQYKVGPVPVNAIAGVVALAPAFFLGKSPIAQATSVNAGMSLLKCALYRMITDNVEAGV
jgi:hypothetical protein